MIRSRTTLAPFAALAVTATFSLGACGDDDEPSSDTSVDTTASSPEQTAGTEPDVTEPDVTEPDDTEPDVTEPDVTEPDGTGDAGDETEDAWREDMNALCEETRETGAALEEPETVGEFKDSLPDIVDIGDSLIDDAQQLDTPDSLQTDVDELVGLWEDKRQQLEGLPEQFDEAGYTDDQQLSSISDEEAQQVAGEALDQSDLTAQAAQLDITCFGNT